MGDSDLDGHLKQLLVSVNRLIEANENVHPVDDWNYSDEQLNDLVDMYEFRKMQVIERMKYVKGLLDVR